MSLIDSTYFSNNIINIPTGTYDAAVLTSFITRYEKEILIRVLGYELWKLINADPTTPQRIADIVDGKEYTVGDYTIKWNGLANTDKISFIAYYVYYQYVKHKATFFLPVGNVKPQTENAMSADVSQKLMTAWHEMRELIGYPGQDIYAPSLYNFMMDNVDTYTEWIFNEVYPVNAFDI